MQNPGLNQFTHSVMWMIIPVAVLAGVVNSLPKKGRSRSSSRSSGTNRNGGWADNLVLAPWWVSFGLALLAFLVLPRLIPIAAPLAGVFGLLFVSLSALSVLRKWKTSHALDTQTSLESIVALPWKRFEDLLGEVYRRQGYKVTETLGGGADGGVDLILSRNGDAIVVQCKRWTNQTVPVQTVRELYGVMHHRGAGSAKLVTTSNFTSEAVAFAQGKPIELVGAGELLQLIRSVQKESIAADTAASTAESMSVHDSPDCPSCRAPMVKRTARRGANVGSEFYGCSNYPRCRGTRQLMVES